MALSSGSALAQTRTLMIPGGHKGTVRTVRFSPDGRLIASGSDDGTLKLWDAGTGRLLRTINDYQGDRGGISFSPDGKRLATDSDAGALKLWNVVTGTLVRTFSRHPESGSPLRVSFSPDGRHIATASEDLAPQLWDVASGRLVRSFPATRWTHAIAFDPSGKRLLTGAAEGTLGLWDVASGKAVRAIRSRQRILSVGFSPDGTQLLSSGWEEGVGANRNAMGDATIKLWGAKTGALVRTIKAPGGDGASVSFSPDGKRIVSGGEQNPTPGGADANSFRIWDAAGATPLRSFHAVQGYVRDVSFSPDGSQVVSGGEDGAIRVWDAGSARQVRTLSPAEGAVGRAAMSDDGRILLVAAGSFVTLWDVASGTVLRSLRTHSGGVIAVELSPGGEYLLAAGVDELARATPGNPDGTTVNMKLWEVASGRLLHTIPRKNVQALEGKFSPDGSQVLTGGWDTSSEGVLRLWDVRRGELLRTIAARELTLAVAFSPDGKYLASGNDDEAMLGTTNGALRLWDAATGKPVRTLAGHGRGTTVLRFPRDARTLVSGGADGTIKTWDIATGKLVRTVAAHSSDVGVESIDPSVGPAMIEGGVGDLDVSPDGSRIASGGTDGLVKLWDAASGKTIRSIAAGQGAILAVRLSPDGSRVISTGVDGTTRFWDTATGRLLATLSTVGDEWILVDPTGRYELSPGGASKLYYVSGLETQALEPPADANYESGLLKRVFTAGP